MCADGQQQGRGDLRGGIVGAGTGVAHKGVQFAELYQLGADFQALKLLTQLGGDRARGR
jgi:hypothetical protein